VVEVLVYHWAEQHEQATSPTKRKVRRSRAAAPPKRMLLARAAFSVVPSAAGGAVHCKLPLLPLGANVAVEADDGSSSEAMGAIMEAMDGSSLSLSWEWVKPGQSAPPHAMPVDSQTTSQSLAPAFGAWEEGSRNEAGMRAGLGLASSAQHPLIRAVKEGCTEELQALVASGCPVNSTDVDGRSGLFWGAHGGTAGGSIEQPAHLACMALLLRSCQPHRRAQLVALQDSTGGTALIGTQDRSPSMIVPPCPFHDCTPVPLP
jgi:hypothetical protein